MCIKSEIIKKEVILLDVDDTINNLKKNWCELYSSKYNDDLNPEDVTDWDISKFVKPEVKSDIYELLKTPGLFRDRCTPPEYSVEVTKELSKYYNIYIVSYCAYPENLKEKYEYIDKYFPHISLNQFISCKNKFMIRGQYLIDDYHKNFDGFTGKKILMNASHNIHVDVTSDITRVDNWLDILHYFEKEYDNRLEHIYESGYRLDVGKLIMRQ